jgi:outer membrane protein OmpA-like peptidoglycan-associated protein
MNVILNRRFIACGTVTVAVFLAACAGCSRPDPAPAQASDDGSYQAEFVVGATATRDEPAPQLEPREAQMLKKAVANGTTRLIGYVGSASSRPFVHRDMSVYYDQATREISTDPAKLATEFDKNYDEVQTSFKKAAGTQSQLDVLGLLGVMARSASGKAVLLVHTSGLQTTGLLDLRAQGSELDVDGTIARLKLLQNELPDLSEKEVHFVGLGEVRGPQGKLTEGMRHTVTDLWLKVCGLARAASCDAAIPATGGDPNSTVAVPTVPVPQLGNTVQGAGGAPPDSDAPTLTLALPTGVYFVPEEATFLPGAAAGIKQIMTYLDPDEWTIMHVRLVGHCATKPPANTAHTLSVQRAQRVADALIASGIAPDVFQIEGVGYDDQIVPDLDRAGRLIPEAAEQNRTVVLTATRTRR